ncbi:MAG: lipopolysaccharide transport periplasmic protein LptA [Porticoccaceae bacterium]
MALPSDREQEIHIESDSATREDKTGVSIYEGGVTITQGTIRIQADKVTIHHEGDKVNQIICVGKPARYQQQPKPEDGLVLASGDTIEYYLATDLIKLIGNASVDQQGSTLQGERIDYDINKERVEARGDKAGKQRVRMVIPPNKNKANN